MGEAAPVGAGAEIRHGSGVFMACVVLALARPATAEATSFAGAAGYEHYEGAGQLTRAMLGVGVMKLDQGTEISLAGVRYDDNLAGPGVSVTATLGIALETPLTLRAQGSRFLGDPSYRAWRAKIGPQWSLPAGSSVWLAYARFEDNQEFRSDGAILESATPLAHRVTGKLNASYATAPMGLRSLQVSAGLGWVLVPHLELSGEVGLAQNGVFAASPLPAPTLPILGGPGPSPRGTPENEVSSTALFGVRVLFP